MEAPEQAVPSSKGILEETVSRESEGANHSTGAWLQPVLAESSRGASCPTTLALPQNT